NNNLPQMAEKTDKSNIHGRFGGDIAGIISQFDHISRLGATAIWPTPLLEDNEAAWSYHGYACSDYYHIDPRYGSNELYRDMVEQAHQKGIKVLMDMVPNHCGSTHWWMKDLPYHDWINQFDEFTNTNNVFSANYDINASEYDRLLNNRGWFDKPMPDMNLENPDLLKYFQQWAIWWIEYANLDGLRVDTYPYIEPVPGSLWLKAIREEYPNINIVGECWTRPASAVAYWQSGVKNYNGFDSNLPTVMDFPVEESIRQALETDGKEWGAGMARVYDAMAQDYLYADVNKLFMFLGNHDMDRFADIVKDNDLRRVKLGYVLLATMRGIPQVFAGDEYAMRSADRSIGHSALRMPLPLGKDVTPEQQEMYDFQSRLFQWRKGEPVIHTGRTMHFLGRDNTYAFFRYNESEAVFVFVNASEEERTVPTAHYAEILGKYNAKGKDILSGEETDLSRKDITVAPLSALVVKLGK
ncbi:MAG: alpha-amylase family glycosyl hydrolase, partial [Paludibacteraceae bacterium]